MSGPDELLTPAEHRALEMAGQLFSLIADKVIRSERTGPGDERELLHHIHAIQHMVMAQAAARAYPDRYRLLGDLVPR